MSCVCGLGLEGVVGRADLAQGDYAVVNLAVDELEVRALAPVLLTFLPEVANLRAEGDANGDVGDG